jgi:excisionase family DNA binding protein
METKTPSVGQKVWLTVPEAAEELRIPRSRCYELIQRGELPAVRIGERSLRVNRRELEKFLLENRRVVARGQEQGGGDEELAR